MTTRQRSGSLDHLPALPPVLTASVQTDPAHRVGAPIRPMLHHQVRVRDRREVRWLYGRGYPADPAVRPGLVSGPRNRRRLAG